MIDGCRPTIAGIGAQDNEFGNDDLSEECKYRHAARVPHIFGMYPSLHFGSIPCPPPSVLGCFAWPMLLQSFLVVETFTRQTDHDLDHDLDPNMPL